MAVRRKKKVIVRSTSGEQTLGPRPNAPTAARAHPGAKPERQRKKARRRDESDFSTVKLLDLVLDSNHPAFQRLADRAASKSERASVPPLRHIDHGAGPDPKGDDHYNHSSYD